MKKKLLLLALCLMAFAGNMMANYCDIYYKVDKTYITPGGTAAITFYYDATEVADFIGFQVEFVLPKGFKQSSTMEPFLGAELQAHNPNLTLYHSERYDNGPNQLPTNVFLAFQLEMTDFPIGEGIELFTFYVSCDESVAYGEYPFTTTGLGFPSNACPPKTHTLSVVPAIPSAAESYLVISQDGKTGTFYHDTQKGERQGTVFSLDTYEGLDEDQAELVTKVVFDPSFAEARPTSTLGWFSGMTNLASIEGMEYLDTSEVTNMQGMFSDCEALTGIDVGHFDTSKVTDMRSMFYGCNMTSLDVSNFDLSNLKNSSWMLGYCAELTTLTVSSSMGQLNDMACVGVGFKSPCLLVVPEDFDFGEGVNPSGDSFMWKQGIFTLFDYPEVDEEDPFQKYLDELTEQQEMREEYADPDEELDPFQKYLDLLDNDITLTSPKTMVPGTVLTIANGGFSADAWNGGAHVFDIPEGSGLVLNDITVDFSSEANYGTGSQLGLFDVSGDLTLGEKTVIKGWLDTASGGSNAPYASATDGAAKNRLATSGQVSGAVVSLQSGSTLCIDGARMDNVALLLNADETNVTATAPLQGELNVVVPESALVEGYKLMVGEGYTFTLTDAMSVHIVNGGGEWGAEVAKDGSLSLFPLSILGDVNGDGQVSITDVAAVVDYIIGNWTGYFRASAANVVRDNDITVSDVATLVQMILGY